MPRHDSSAPALPWCWNTRLVTRSSAVLDRASVSPVRVLLLLLLAASSPAFAQIEGYGKDTTGGAGRPVCTVTSSAELGPGTWDSCVRRGGNQTIQFAVPIAKVYTVSYLRSNTTVDGCANGQHGVTLDQPADRKRAVAIEGPVTNVIVRCVRFRGSGPDHPGYAVEDDLLRLDGTGGLVSRVVVDHCTFAGSTDGALDTTGYISDVTESWNLFYGTALTQLIKYDTRQRVSLHHNVYTAGGERNPEIKGDARAIDFVSNVIYNETITRDGLGNTFNPYGTRLWNASSRSDSPGNVRANLRSNFYAGAHAGLDIRTEPGASAAGIYIAPDNVCERGCGPSPAAAPNAVPAGYEVTATPVGCMVYRMLPTVGSPNRSDADLARLGAVRAALPRDCTRTLAVAKAGTGAGIVSSAPSGVACGADCTQDYTFGTVVDLTPAAATGSQFAGWSGACTGTGSCKVTMSAARSVTATFDLIPYPLNVAREGTGSGAVISSSAGISCGADCSHVYGYGTVVTLGRTAAAGSSFAGWSGACTGTGPCQVSMDAARSVTATFNLIPYPLNVAKTGTGSGTVTSSPAGISCGSDCSQAYNYGTVVTLGRSAAGGSTFAGWGGACTGTGSCQVTVNAARSVTATFTRIVYSLTVARMGTGSGTVVSSPAGIGCGASCAKAYNSGTTVVLSPAAAAGSRFAGWSGACAGTGSCQVSMNGARSVTATFNLIPYTLTVAKTGTGSGTVTASPAGIGCGSDCSHAYNYGTLVTLGKSAAGGSFFAGWSGACAGTGSCQVTMNAARTVTAVFNRITYNLTVAKTGTGAGTVVSAPAGIGCGSDCSQAYDSGTVVVLRAAGAAGSSFAGWSGACTGTGSCQVTMNGARSVTASFVRSATASLRSNVGVSTLDVATEGDGSGRVRSSPAGIDCGRDCAKAYPRGSTVSLAATADRGSTFRGWSGACSGTGSCQVDMDGARNLVATFSTPSRGGFYTVAPCRVVDTRLPSGTYGGPPLLARGTRAFLLFGVCGIPTSARAVAVNVTVTQATNAGNLRLFPADIPLPAASSLSYAAGQTRANNVTAGLSRSGGLAIHCDQTAGRAHVIVDVNGYYE